MKTSVLSFGAAAVVLLAGSAHPRSYVDKVMYDKWTEADVERELRKSPEYRRR